VLSPKFGRPETQGIAALVAGIAMAQRDDEKRLARAAAVFEDLFEYFRRKQLAGREPPARSGKEDARCARLLSLLLPALSS
jgi:hypothetical protein